MDAHTDREVRTNETGDRKGLLEDLSLSQVLAGALAAVTSVALSSKIGIAGSLIGVAVASVVSTVASQLYRGMLRRANDKIRELAASDGEESAAESSNPYGPDGHATTVTPRPDAASAARIAPAELREAAHQRRAREVHRRVMVAAVVSSLAAVAISAGVVLLATNGEGLGQHTGSAAPAQETATTSAATHAATAEQQRPETPKASENGAETSSASSSSQDGSSQQGGANNATTGSAGTDNAEQPGTADTPTEATTSEAAE